MIFDLTAASGGKRKYLFHNGNLAEEFKNYTYNSSFAKTTVDENGITVIVDHFELGAKYFVFRLGDSNNKLDFSKYKKLYFLFDYVDPGVSGGIFVTSDYAVGQYSIRDVARASFGENAEPTIVEVDVSTVTGKYYLTFDMNLSKYEGEDMLGKGYRIRSIWYK